MGTEAFSKPMNRVARNIKASVPYTCGELFQGTLQGEPCLVSCPIAIGSEASFKERRENSASPGRKVQEVLKKIQPVLLAPQDLRVQTRLPAGRGFGTSTADIGSALFAVSAHCGIELSAEEAARLAVSVEPTDSTFFPGLALFAHRSGKFSQVLGEAPALKILIADPGGFVDSEEFNNHDWGTALKHLSGAHVDAFMMLRTGIEKADINLIGQAASLSAQIHQAILYNPFLEKALQLGKQIGAVGVCRAHSGTIFGFLLAEEHDDEVELIDYCQKHLPGKINWTCTRILGGGARFITDSNDTSEALQR